ncbi:YceI family protein [Roseospira goensis]|uniref:Polyisoprenoid-binding protein YceI n=1 Tax=Roseospira goensis TaxID=391922 RepID=A0A7W6S1G5_9PROT|nr:YceI family protein [Roseospira goensis]MBB4286972.1 polyisoprenoid-binding protein YceI [Roseospira goensis]
MITPLASPPRPRRRARAVAADAGAGARRVRVVLAAGLGLLLALAAAQAARAATWTLDDGASFLSFASIKAFDIGEVHSFSDLSGGVAEDGTATVRIDLGSVNTGIDIRNERMRDMLFNVAQFPVATITASVPLDNMESLAVGDSAVRDVTAQFSLVGESNDLAMPVMVTRLGEGRVMVQPLQVLMVQADDYALGEGIRKLREVAGLEHISHAVPATFTLFFDRTE